jgi:hypothetical protein
VYAQGPIPRLAPHPNPYPACQLPLLLQSLNLCGHCCDPLPQPHPTISTTTPCPVPTQPVYLVNLCVCKPVAWVREHIRHADVLSLVFAVLAETLAGNHHWHRRLGDQVVTERSKQHTAMVSFMRLALAGSTYPFRALRPLDPRMTSVGSSMSICQNDLSACIPKRKMSRACFRNLPLP